MLLPYLCTGTVLHSYINFHYVDWLLEAYFVRLCEEPPVIVVRPRSVYQKLPYSTVIMPCSIADDSHTTLSWIKVYMLRILYIIIIIIIIIM